MMVVGMPFGLIWFGVVCLFFSSLFFFFFFGGGRMVHLSDRMLFCDDYLGR